MEHLEFTLWLLLWYPTNKIGDYFSLLFKEKIGIDVTQKYDENRISNNEFLEFIVWIVIAIILY
jgi:hypothetical protein